MSDKRKPVTIIAELRRELKHAQAERDDLSARISAQTNRYIAAQRERDEWKRRFDELLSKLSVVGVRPPETGGER